MVQIRTGTLLVIICAALAAAGCGSSSNSSSGSSSSPSASPQGTANVAYASSLQFLNEKVAGPAFTKATGYQYSGRGASSGELESDIAAKEISPNVFESVGGDNITPLEPKFTKWYIPYAGTQMVVAYNPNSKYASQFKAYADGVEAAQGPVHRCCRPRASSWAGPTPTSTRRAATSSTCSNWPRCTTTCPRTRSARSSARRTAARPTRRRSSPSPRWTPRCSPASSTRPARSSPRRVELHLALHQAAGRRSTWATPRWPTQYAKATVTIKPPGSPRRPSPARRR